MDWQEILGGIKTVLDTRLFELGGRSTTVATIATVLIVVLVTFWLSRVIQRAVERVFIMRGVKGEGTIGAIKRLLHYAVLAVGLGIALQTIGIELGALFAAGAIFAVGIGFAMQNIAQNFVSGVILLVERAIKPGDILSVEGEVVRVRQMGIRATVVRTLDEEEVIVPNSLLVQAAVKNYTLSDNHYRIRILVGVTYGSDMKRVRDVLEGVANDLDWRDRAYEPRVLLSEFGSSSVDFEVSVWVDDPWAMRTRGSELREAIWWALKDADVVIAFPQVDVHFDPPVERGLAALSSVGR